MTCHIPKEKNSTYRKTKAGATKAILQEKKNTEFTDSRQF